MASSILGIHSNYENADSSSLVNGTFGKGQSSAKMGGHAWISVTHHGATKCYGLWPDNHPMTIDNGDESDIRMGLESIAGARASRYYALSLTQVTQLNRELKSNTTWKNTFNCSSWASDLVQKIVKEDVDADDWGLLGAETPRKLSFSIKLLEAKQKSSMLNPISTVGS